MDNFIETVDWESAAEYIKQFNLNFNALGLNKTIQSGHSDAFSKCQLYTKFKIAEVAVPIIQKQIDDVHGSHYDYERNVTICGSWIGTMTKVLHSYAQHTVSPIMCDIYNFDLDPVAIDISQDMFTNSPGCYSAVEDIHNVDYSDSLLIINPITEHIQSTKKWLECLPKEKHVIMTSTDYKKPNDHINISKSMDDFCSQCDGLVNIDTTLTIRFPIYERYIILGRT